MFSSRGALSLLPGARWGRGVPGELRCRAWGVLCSQALWTALHARANFLNLKIKTQLEHSPRPPWLGVLLEPGLLPGSPARKWLEDFARCLSWAVLDQVRSRARPGAGMGELMSSGICAL